MRRAAQYVLYATIPVALYLQFTHGPVVWEFVFACAAVIPIAAWIGISTEQLAHRMGPTYGALFNATFGNFAILIVSYALGLLFSFKTHADHLVAVADAPRPERGEIWPLRRALLLLLAASALMSVVAEGLVEAVRQAGHAWGMNEVFMG